MPTIDSAFSGDVQIGAVEIKDGATDNRAAVSAGGALSTADAAVLAKLTSDPATQTTLAAILAKLLAAPATEAKQDSLISANHTDLAAILTKFTDGLQVVKTYPAASATLANVASSASSVTLQASNANRRGWMVFNDSTAILYVKFGATASATSYVVQIPAGGYYEMPLPTYTGVVDGIWASANGNARVTEIA